MQSFGTKKFQYFWLKVNLKHLMPLDFFKLLEAGLRFVLVSCLHSQWLYRCLMTQL